MESCYVHIPLGEKMEYKQKLNTLLSYKTEDSTHFCAMRRNILLPEKNVMAPTINRYCRVWNMFYIIKMRRMVKKVQLMQGIICLLVSQRTCSTVQIFLKHEPTYDNVAREWNQVLCTY